MKKARNDMEPLYDVKRAAAVLGLTRDQLWDRIESGNPLWTPSHDLNKGGLKRKFAYSATRLAEIRAQLSLTNKPEAVVEGAK